MNFSFLQTVIVPQLKVSKSRKHFMVSLILPKKERWDNFHNIKLSQRSFFGRIKDTINCFRDLLTFSVQMDKGKCSEMCVIHCLGSKKHYFLPKINKLEENYRSIL